MENETEVVLMRLCAMSPDRFELRGIEVDSYSWNGTLGNAFIVPEGYELVIRQNGRDVSVIRRKR